MSCRKKKKLEESRAFAAYIQSCILVMLHPFIPFFTEKIWLDLKLDSTLKKPLMLKDWKLSLKPNLSFKKSYQKIDWLIQLISNIRSTKVNLDISPGSFIDVSIGELNKDKKDIINKNISVFKRLGRISNIYDSKINKHSINIIVGIDTLSLYFDKDVNLHEQKLKLSSKAKELNNKLFNLKKKLENKSFLKNAPKLIIQNEKNSLLKYNIELKKLNSILNSIKD